jgi:hypothetical protein
MKMLKIVCQILANDLRLRYNLILTRHILGFSLAWCVA